MNQSFLRVLIVSLGSLISATLPAFSQGNLVPPGPPGPTMRTLTQIEPRTPISSLPFTITNTGSYYLTTNLGGASGQSGIIVQASGVTLNLEGFALTGVAGSLLGVSVSAPVQNFALYNGTISGWGGNGVDGGNAAGSEFQHLRISNNGGAGLVAGSGSTISGCVAVANGSTGISSGEASTVTGCITRTNLGDGILVATTCLVENNTSEGNGNGGTTAGIHATGTANRIEGNLSTYNNGNGFAADGIRNLIVKNSARGNTGTDYAIAANNNYGQLYLNPGAGFTNNNPWANFSATCPTNQAECVGACAVIATDPNNCGTCGNVCPPVPNGTGGCTNSACAIGSCNAGYADCDHNLANGCEVSLANNVSNCGSCGNVCPYGPNSTPICSGSSCNINCSAGYGNCDNNPANGCEVNLLTTVNNCGSCGHLCVVANGTPGCTSGSCTVASCNAGYANCDNNPANGCEVSLSTDPNNCGGCGITCAGRPNVSSANCSGSACHVLACNSGYADCDLNFSNGCEINTTNDRNNCGTCGNVCAVGKNCVSSVCM